MNAWVVAPELGKWASTDADGRFLLHKVPPGKVEIIARTMDGGEAKATIEIPHDKVDLVIGAPKKAKK
jgi:hypothetical protein